VVRLREELPYRAVKFRRRSFHAPARARRALEQIGPSDIADKNEIAGERAHWLLSSIEIGNEECQMLWGVSGCVSDAQPDGAERDLRRVAQRVCVGESITRVSPFLPTLRGQVQLRAGSVGERSRARHEVRVNVGFRYMGDSYSLRARGAGVLGDVDIRVYDDSFACSLTGDQVARLRQIVVIETLKEHCVAEESKALLEGVPIVSVL
jgi:hypothetical protein